jgi:DNA-binding NarL/FixJ family response regulator
VAVFTWDFDPAVVARLTRLGCRGYLSKGLAAENLVVAIEQVAAGHEVVSANPSLDRHSDDRRDWPGRQQGLSERESELLVLIAEGFSNLEIAAALNISINSVKSHVRSSYRKLGVSTRAQAVRRVLDLGMVRPKLHA